MFLRRQAFIFALLVFPLVGCDDDPEPKRSIDVSGTIDNRTGATLPNPANQSRVVVAWVVSSGTPDYTYVWGQGTLTQSGESFSVRLDAPPPDSALNGGMLGVGLVIAVEGAGFENGDLTDEDGTGIIGLAGQYAVIYVGEGSGGPDWVEDFPEGYSVGVGVDVEGGFDAFEPASAGSVELIIDDLANIDVVNWT